MTEHKATIAEGLRKSVYALTFLYSIQFGLVLFFNSSFLASLGYDAKMIGIIFAAGYACATIALAIIPWLLPRFGDRRLFAAALIIGAALCAMLGTQVGSVAVILPLALAVSIATYALLDIFLQTASANADKVGGRRGLMATLTNSAYILAQFIAIAILAYGSFPLLYGATAVLLVGVALLGYVLLLKFRDARYEKPDWGGIFTRLSSSRDIRNVFYVQFLLRLFYSIMVIYTPIYLHQHIGLSLGDMGIVFAVMLLPFLLLEIPIGRLADTRWGEQEVLVSGFVIIALATIGVALIGSTSVAVWATALFATRVGAALLDVGSEAYFFKHVKGRDSGEVSAFRMLYPIAYIVGPLAAIALLTVLPLKFIFVALGAVMLLGLIPALSLRDTR